MPKCSKCKINLEKINSLTWECPKCRRKEDNDDCGCVSYHSSWDCDDDDSDDSDD